MIKAFLFVKCTLLTDSQATLRPEFFHQAQVRACE